MTNIYHLIDPILNQPVYVGATKKPLNRRLQGHISKPHSYRLRQWVSFLKERGELPKIELLEEVDDDAASEREEKRIAELSSTTPAFALNSPRTGRTRDKNYWHDRMMAYLERERYVSDEYSAVACFAEKCGCAVRGFQAMGMSDAEVRLAAMEFVDIHLRLENGCEYEIPEWIAKIIDQNAEKLVESMKA